MTTARTALRTALASLAIGAALAVLLPGGADAAVSLTTSSRVDGTPLAVAADGLRSRIYVATSEPNAIRIVDGATRTTIDSIVLPPTSRIVDLAVFERPNRIYALDAGSNQLLVINGGTVTVRETLELPGLPRALAVDDSRGFVYVTTTHTEPTPGGTLTQVLRARSVVSGQVIERHVVRATRSLSRGARGVAVHRGVGAVYVVSAAPYRTVARYDEDGLAQLGSFRFGSTQSSPTAVAVADTVGGDVYVADTGTDRLRTLPTFINVVTGVHAIGDGPVDVAINDETGRVYVASRAAGTVTVLGPRTAAGQSVEETIEGLALPSGIAVTLANHRVFVATSGPANRLTVLARFDPAAHGFAFANSWTLGLSFAIPVPPFQVDIGSPYGLCGGMVFGALDAFNAGTRTPADATVPAVGTPLHTYVFGRLLDSLAGGFGSVFARYAEWQILPVEDVVEPVAGTVVVRGLRSRSADALTVAAPSLDRGRPVPLGLVLVDVRSPVWMNHQVLAIGHTVNASGEQVVEIYDPNGPGAPRYLQTERLLITEDVDGASPVLRAGIPWTYRGFFITDYAPRRPVWVT